MSTTPENHSHNPDAEEGPVIPARYLYYHHLDVYWITYSNWKYYYIIYILGYSLLLTTLIFEHRNGFEVIIVIIVDIGIFVMRLGHFLKLKMY